MSTLAYHLEELEIARTVGHPNHVLPNFPLTIDSVLDIGCGAGQTLVACNFTDGTFVCGLDQDTEALSLGRQLTRGIHFLCGQGESLPFENASFAGVFSRVALPYMHIPTALHEMARITKPGGHIWLLLHPFSMTFQSLGSALLSGNPKRIAYQCYILANSLLFHLTGQMIRYPLARKRCESFQTATGITRALQGLGFENIKVEKGRFFVVTAVKAR